MSLRARKFLALFIPIALILFSCQTTTDLGSEVLNLNTANLQTFVEDLSVNPKMFFVDSINTTNRGQLLVGQTIDPNFGMIECKSYTRLSPPFYTDSITSVSADDEYVSCRAVLLRDGYSYGSFAGTQSLQLVELSQAIESALSESEDFIEIKPDPQFYSFHESRVKPEPIGIGVFDEETDSIIFNLSDEFGQRLFDMISGNIETIFSSQSNFNSFLPGIALLPDNDNASIVGINSFNNVSFIELTYGSRDSTNNPTFRFFLDRSTDDSSDSTAAFSVGYYNITINESQQPFNSLIGTTNFIDPIDSTLYFQPLTGIFTSIDLQNYLDWKQTNDNNIVISDVRLIIGPVKEPFQGFDTPGAIGYFNSALEEFNPDNVSWETTSIRSISGDPVESFYNSETLRYDNSIQFFANLLVDGSEDSTRYFTVPVFVDEQSNFAISVDGLNSFVVNEGDIRLRVIYSTFD